MVSSAHGTRSKVLCVGLGKTGTKTLAECMKVLGFRHLSMRGTDEYSREDWNALLRKAQSYDSFDDFPWCYLYDVFEENFPNVRFILTRRKDVDTWYASLCRHYCRTGPTHAKKLFYGYYSPYENAEHHKSLYLEHNEKIRARFGEKNTFLEVCWEQGDGWQELCSFLNLPLPDRRFPMKNVGKSDYDYTIGKRAADAKLEELYRSGRANASPGR